MIPSNRGYIYSSTNDVFYLYGGVAGGSDGMEIGLQYSSAYQSWSAYLAVNKYYPPAGGSNAYNNDYNSQGFLIPVLSFPPGQPIAHQMYITRDVNNSSIYYLIGTFNGSVVGYKVNPNNYQQTYKVPGLNPSNLSNIVFRTVAAIAQKTKSLNGSQLCDSQMTNLRLLIPTSVTYQYDDITWTLSRNYEDCVNDQIHVNSWHPTEDSNYTDINLTP